MSEWGWQSKPGAVILAEALQEALPNIRFYVTEKRLGPRHNRTDGETDVVYSVAVCSTGNFGEHVEPELFEINVNSNQWDHNLVVADTRWAVKQKIAQLKSNAKWAAFREEVMARHPEVF